MSEYTTKELDDICERFDLTSPKLQREIVAALATKIAALESALAEAVEERDERVSRDAVRAWLEAERNKPHSLADQILLDELAARVGEIGERT